MSEGHGNRVQTPPLLLVQHSVCCLQLGIVQECFDVSSCMVVEKMVGEEEGNEERKNRGRKGN